MKSQDKNLTEEQKLQEEQVQEEQTETEDKQQSSDNSQKNNALEQEYLNLARVIQADFDNYRKRSLVQIEKAKIDGIVSAVEIFLPSLDAFKNVKDKVQDEKTLEGIDMLERAIISNFEKLGIEKIDAVGKQLDPNVHNVLAVAKDESKEDGVILQEFQAGYKMQDKIIRCSQVLVNKLD